MAKDIWAEKPDEKDPKYSFGEHPSTGLPQFNSVYFLTDMDSWLEKLRSSFDESIADCHHSLELVAKKLGEYMEKAEKLENIKTMVDRSVDFWRDKEDDPDRRYYLDAYRSVQLNIKDILGAKG